MSKTLVRCRCCEGKGIVELSPDMERTLSAVAWDSWRCTLDIIDRLNDRYVKSTAVNNRLRALEDSGLIVSEKRGKPIFWRRKAKASAK